MAAPLAVAAPIALIQFAVTQYFSQQIPTGIVADGMLYITEARALQNRRLDLLQHFESGLYPVFLSFFDFSALQNWATASTHPALRAIYNVQSVMLAACTFLLVAGTWLLASSGWAARFFTSLTVGLLLLSPLAVVWPSFAFTETMTICVLLLLAGAALACDGNRRWGLAWIGALCCLLVLVREPMIFFVWIFLGLIGINFLSVRGNRNAAVVVGIVLLLLSGGLGLAKASLLGASTRNYHQLLINIIQFRILPDPEHRAFFAERGLPLSPIVMERAGKPAWHQNTLFLSDSELQHMPNFIAYREWVRSRGTRAYLAFLATHPGYLFRSLYESPSQGADIEARDFHFSVLDLFALPQRGYLLDRLPYPEGLRNFLLAPFGWALTLLYVLYSMAKYVWRTARHERTSCLGMLGIAAAGAIFISYHADAWDLWRHAAPLLLTFYLSALLRIPELLATKCGAIGPQGTGRELGTDRPRPP